MEMPIIEYSHESKFFIRNLFLFAPLNKKISKMTPAGIFHTASLNKGKPILKGRRKPNKIPINKIFSIFIGLINFYI